MALVLADRVRETTTTTGTGTVTLSGTAPTGYQTFSTAIGNANTTYYTINAGFQWEVGIGTYTAAGLTLSRTTVLSSSSGGALVDFAVGTKDVFVTYPAEKSVNYDANNNVGIGTTAPSARLEVNTVNTAIKTSGTSSGSILEDIAITRSSSGTTIQSGPNLTLSDGTVNNTITIQNSQGNLAFWNYGSAAWVERMRINSAGNVGIGTTAPTEKLEVVGAAFVHSDSPSGISSIILRNDSVATNTTKSLTVLFQGKDTVGTTKSSGLIVVNPTDQNYIGSYMAFATRGSDTLAERMRINGSGNVGIGTTGYGNKLDVYLTSTQYALFGGGIGTGNGNYAGIALGYSEPGPIYQKSAIVQAQTGDGSARGTIHILNNGASSTANATLADARLSVTSDGNVGIGTTTPGRLLQVGGSGGYIKVAYIPGNYNFDGLYLSNATANGGAKAEFIAHSTVDTSQSWKLQQDSDAAVAAFTFNYASPASTYAGLSYSEKMRITNAGNVGIGTSAPAYKLDVTGTISANGGMRPVFLVGSSVATSIFWDGAQFYPGVDGTILLGYPSWRWNTVYATTGTINTSDGNEKQDINLLNDAEKNVAVRLKSLVRSFKFNDAVAAKGAAARVHFGLIAQDVASAFEAEGLYPHRYAMFCSDTWYEVDGKPSTDVNDPFTKDTEGAVEKTRLGIRYDELIVFMISVL